MDWITPSTDDVLSELMPQEQATLASIQGATDRLSQILPRIIAEVRGHIAAGNYELGPDGTIPDALQEAAIALARWRWLVGFPQLAKLQTKEREQAYKDADEHIDRIAKGKHQVAGVSAAANPRTGQWNSQNKLIMRTHPVPPPTTQWQDTDDTQRPYANPDGPSDQ